MRVMAVCVRMAIAFVVMRMAQNCKFFKQKKRQQSA
jgi:hypothetical protein